MRQRSGVTRAPTPPRVTVVGSLNTDISLAVPHLPGPGETVLSAADAVSLDPAMRMLMLEAAQHRLSVIEGEVVSESEG